MSRHHLLSLTFCLLLSLVGPLVAQEELPPERDGKPVYFAQFWIDESATVGPDAVAQTLADLARQGDRFDHILVMSHGFDLDEKTSTRQLELLSEKFLHEFQTKGAQRIGLVSLQWQSATGATLFPLGGDYLRKIALARSAGRGPARELLLALQETYPESHISLLGHSTGNELTTAALVPELVYDGTEPFVDTFAPEQELKVLIHFLVGSDVNYDLFYTGQVSPEQAVGRSRLVWQTMVPVLPDDKDNVLILRAHFIGRPTGSRFPRLTPEQLDKAVKERRWLIDSHNIPISHLFVDYFKDARIEHMADTMKSLANPKAPKPQLLADLEAVLAAPNDVASIAPHLDHRSSGVTFYALWRLEQLLCQGSQHLTDETYEKAIQTLRTYPQKIWRTYRNYECQTLRRELFPSSDMMTRAGAPDWARPAKWR